MKHIHVDVCDSTQELVKEQLNQVQSSEHILASCDHQTHGRGRGSNEWIVMPGTLCFSLTIEAHCVPSFTALEMAVLVARFFSERKNKHLALKWPNDLWNEQGIKCCGILIQSFQHRMIAGIGLNLFSGNESFGGIYEESFEFDKKNLSREISDFIISHRYSSTDLLITDWETRCPHLGKKVSITEGTEKNEGIFLGLGPHGEARLQRDESILHLYNGSLRLID